MRGVRLGSIRATMSRREQVEDYLDRTNPIELPENRKRREGKVRYVRS